MNYMFCFSVPMKRRRTRILDLKEQNQDYLQTEEWTCVKTVKETETAEADEADEADEEDEEDEEDERTEVDDNAS